jgi:3-isopropylmalate/(R)-2-methylmalate dehydratase small subunit
MRENFRHRFTGNIVKKFGDNIDTDVIYPARFLSVIDPVEMAKHALKTINEDFQGKLGENSVIVAGHNFGCGSSREQAVTSLKFAGVAAVVAKGFSRIYYRNAINHGCLLLQCIDAVDNTREGVAISIDLDKGKIMAEGKEFAFNPFPPIIMEIMNSGGLIEYTIKQIKSCKRLSYGT